jgi:hypothetical protein
MKIQIGGHAIDHPFQVTQGLHEDASPAMKSFGTLENLSMAG